MAILKKKVCATSRFSRWVLFGALSIGSIGISDGIGIANNTILEGDDVSASFYISHSSFDKKSQQTTMSATAHITCGSHDIKEWDLNCKDFIVDRSLLLKASMWKEMARPAPEWRVGPYLAAEYSFTRQNLAMPLESLGELSMRHQNLECLFAVKAEKDMLCKSSERNSKGIIKNRKCLCKIQSQAGIWHRFGAHYTSSAAMSAEGAGLATESLRTVKVAHGPNNVFALTGLLNENLPNDWRLKGQISGKFGKKYECYAAALTIGKEF
jgi:hypothetical protein